MNQGRKFIMETYIGLHMHDRSCRRRNNCNDAYCRPGSVQNTRVMYIIEHMNAD